MNVAFVCWRPYQVFNTIRIISSNMLGGRNDYDLYLYDIPSLTKIKKNLEQSNCFKNVYLFKDKKSGFRLIRWKRKLFNLIFPMHALEEGDLSGVRHKYDGYDLIMSSGWEAYFISLANANPDVKIYQFEDGTSTYLGDERDRLSIWRYLYWKFIKILFNKGIFSIDVSRVYVNNKDLVNCKYPCDVIQIPEITDKEVAILNRVFNYEDSNLYKTCKIIYLCEPPRLTQNTTEEEMCVPLLRYKNEVLLRPHPGFPLPETKFKIDKSGSMWELVSLNTNARILISNFSSAALTPQMLYKKDFHCVFLYKIMSDDEKMNKEKDAMIALFKKEKSNIYVPTTYDEYVELINKLMKSVG